MCSKSELPRVRAKSLCVHLKYPSDDHIHPPPGLFVHIPPIDSRFHPRCDVYAPMIQAYAESGDYNTWEHWDPFGEVAIVSTYAHAVHAYLMFTPQALKGRLSRIYTPPAQERRPAQHLRFNLWKLPRDRIMCGWQWYPYDNGCEYIASHAVDAETLLTYLGGE